MAADPQPGDAPETPPQPVDAHAIRGMAWVMPIWLIAFLVVVVAGIVSYLFGWWYQGQLRDKASDSRRSFLSAPHSPTSQTRIVS